jgi:hypothetical protein
MKMVPHVLALFSLPIFSMALRCFVWAENNCIFGGTSENDIPGSRTVDIDVRYLNSYFHTGYWTLH